MAKAQKQKNNEEIRVHVRMSGRLAHQITQRTGSGGLYENTGEYIRALVRKDIESAATLEDHLDIVWKHILPGFLADESEFKPVTLKEIQKRGRQKKQNG